MKTKRNAIIRLCQINENEIKKERFARLTIELFFRAGAGDVVFIFENTVKLTAVFPRLNRVLLRERGCFKAKAAAFLYVEAAAVEADIE